MRTICVGLLFVFATAALAETPTCPPNYSYSGFTQPAQWRYVEDWECDPVEFPLQSPINIAGTFNEQRDKPITITYQPMLLTVKNSGHDFRVMPTLLNTISVDDIESATLDNFHFHTPAEHTILGQARLDGEIHFVHKDDKTGRTIVIAILLRAIGANNNVKLQPIIDQLPVDLCDSEITPVTLQPLLTSPITTYYRYIGSLTTPKCDGDVTFFVVPAVMGIGQSQLTALRRFGDNARVPPMDRNGREIIYVRP
jgi:carbonic anhydrase